MNKKTLAGIVLAVMTAVIGYLGLSGELAVIELPSTETGSTIETNTGVTINTGTTLTGDTLTETGAVETLTGESL